MRVPGATGMARPRLDRLIDGAWQVPLSAVTAPAGWGKTTLLADFARRHRSSSRAVAWYGADGAAPTVRSLLVHLGRAVADVAPEVDPGWDSVEAAVAALGRAPVRPIALVVDHAHTLTRTSAGLALVQLAGRLPPDVHLILAGRSRPVADPIRPSSTRPILEIGPDDLRFSLPEVEELFSAYHGLARGTEELVALARRTGGRPAGLALFHLATAHETDARRRELLRGDHGAAAAHPAGALVRPAPARLAPVRLRVVPGPDALSVHCLGRFELLAGLRRIDVRALKPRFGAVLQYLAVHAGQAVHRDALCTAFWPGEDDRSGHRSLQVAISAIRQLLEAEAGAGAAMVRRGESYLLEHRGGFHDLTALEQGVRSARRGRVRGAGTGEAAVLTGLREAAELYRGDLLAEIGNPEWVLEPRDRYRLLATEAHRLLAERLLGDDQPEEAAAVAERGLAVDRYSDGLWRLMIEAHDRSANRAAGAQARRSYRLVLAELGVGS
jgi:DNA-binding SARP family transcriptional activator